MKPNRPRNSVLIEIPNCAMQASTTTNNELLFILGWPKDYTMIQFKRRALQRFIRLATDILTAPTHDPSGNHPTLLSTPD